MSKLCSIAWQVSTKNHLDTTTYLQIFNIFRTKSNQSLKHLTSVQILWKENTLEQPFLLQLPIFLQISKERLFWMMKVIHLEFFLAF